MSRGALALGVQPVLLLVAGLGASGGDKSHERGHCTELAARAEPPAAPNGALRHLTIPG